jgi:outer membrane protein TolC
MNLTQKTLVLNVLLMLAGPAIQAQQVVTLRECYERAGAESAISSDKEAYSGLWQIRDKNLTREWLPSLDANGSFVYHSSVADLSEVIGGLPVPGLADMIKPMPHEQYRLSLEVNQLIYDGGAVKGARALEKAGYRVSEKQLEADLYALRGQVTHYYFGILLLDRQRELLESYLETIEKRMASLDAAILNGMVLKSDLDVLLAGKLGLTQQITENRIRREALLKVLSDITGITLDASVKLMLPVAGVIPGNDLQRPELQLFDLKKEQLDVSKQLIDSRKMPRLFGFATLGYGNPPGNNFFKDEFAPFAVVGAGVRWNIFDWNKSAGEKQVVALQQDLLENRKSDLAATLNRLSEAKLAEIRSLESLLETDEQIIELRQRITATAGSQYESGTITATEYLNELNAEKQAVISHEIHQISLALARVEYLNILGKEIN